MKLYEQSYEILTDISPNAETELRAIENAARTCYKSAAKSGDLEKTMNFVARLIRVGHEAMLEHSILSVRFTTNRAIANELVRHRLSSFAQESTRYCNYSKEGRFEGSVGFILPSYFEPDTAGFEVFKQSCEDAENAYFKLLEIGYMPEQARDALGLSTKTDIIVTANYREWRHILNLRAGESTGPVHPMMKELMVPLVIDLHKRIPVIFDDIKVI